MMKTKMIASVHRAARLPLITKDSDILSQFHTNDPESNKNCLKLVKKHTQLGFNRKIEAVQRLGNTENEKLPKQSLEFLQITKFVGSSRSMSYQISC